MHLGLNQHPVFSSGIITMYGNTKVTSAVHGCHGNPILYWLLHLTIIKNFVKVKATLGC